MKLVVILQLAAMLSFMFFAWFTGFVTRDNTRSRGVLWFLALTPGAVAAVCLYQPSLLPLWTITFACGGAIAAVLEESRED